MILGSYIPVKAEGVEIDLQASHAVLISSTSGSVLFEKDSKSLYESSSMVKLMSVYTSSKLEDSTITYTNTEGLNNVLGLTDGMQCSKEDLMYATFYQGYEDCAYALGTQEDFVKNMNIQADTLGLNDSVFVNAIGTSAEGQSVTAKDMALVGAALAQDSTLKDMYASTSYSPSTLTEGTVFNRDPIEYDGLVGFYDGIDSDGKYSCILSAKRDGTEVTAVVFQEESKEIAHAEAIKLLDYGLDNYKTIVVSKEEVGEKTEGNATYSLSQDLSLLMPIQTDESKLKYSIEITGEGDDAKGYVIFTLNEEEVGRVLLDKTVEETKELSTTEKIVRVINYGCAVIAGVFIMVFVLRHGSAFIKPEGE